MTTTPAVSPPIADEVALRKALASAPRPRRASALSAVLTFGWRGMLKVKHVPEQLLDVTITPVMFVLLFTFLFGGAIAGSTGDYLDYILPGILVMSVLFTTVYSGVALNTDLTKGVVDRFRSLPIWRPAPLIGALLGDSVRYLVAGTVIVVLGVILGYRPDNGVPGVALNTDLTKGVVDRFRSLPIWRPAPLVGALLGDSVRYLVAGTVIVVLGVILGYRPGAGVGGVVLALALVIAFSFGLSWVFTTLGLLLRSPQAVMNAGFMAIFPVTFLSNVFVEPKTLPAGLEAFVEVNPVSILADCSRGLMAGSVDGGDLTIVLGTAAALTAVFAPLTTRLYRTRS